MSASGALRVVERNKERETLVERDGCGHLLGVECVVSFADAKLVWVSIERAGGSKLVLGERRRCVCMRIHRAYGMGDFVDSSHDVRA